MAWLLERLEAWKAAARTRVEGLRAEMDRLAERLAAEQALLERLEITTQPPQRTCDSRDELLIRLIRYIR